MQTVFLFTVVLYRASEFYVDAETCQFRGKRLRHLLVQRRQYMSAPLDDGDVQSSLFQIFGDFQSDETCPDDNDVFRSRRGVF